jgi:hypothetical protein
MLMGMRDKDVLDEVQLLREKPRSAEVSPEALAIHVRAVTAAAHTDYPAFVSDECLDSIAPGDVTTIAALELCLAELWLRARDGYVVVDLDLVNRMAGSPILRRMRAAGRRLWVLLNSETVIPL